ncbi:aminoacyl-tRNA hydrolase [Vulcanibacillus modesticaldus]|uniref:Peptidyl-tRNA hydrolase n=1 Tax=Vulcanibacillus modesticaldus TaxID=337097 RepID=A0A1D2YXB8_9BACI|nr:aminoacyl-tRNA hydrolase [Vulcanibacillus modesticaldus]OEG00293.1 aminoacyl-tRNA hydrolase [Vulcanibacillus modesticaldus]
MKIIVGLGNPGKKYEYTKHNIGFLTIDNLTKKIGENSMIKDISKFNALITKISHNNQQVLLVKPLTYMNLSGEAVRPILDWYKIDIEDMIIIYDDLDLPLGKIRIREKGSAGGHNGMKSIIQNVGTDQFKRIRIGIDRKEEIPVVDYVLTPFSAQEKTVIEKSINTVSDAIIDWINGVDFKKIMSTYQ